ncbi:MAG: SH3 domain-containing protein [Blautia sp.]|nr:SH3 domain-containing protein [Blautia sp.]
MKRACFLGFILAAALCLPGCGFTEGAGATVTVVTPTPMPTPTPEPTPTPAPTPVPQAETEQTASGVTVTKGVSAATALADVNLRSDANVDAQIVASVAMGTELTQTGVCDNGWVQLEYNGQVVYALGEYVNSAAAQ